MESEEEAIRVAREKEDAFFLAAYRLRGIQETLAAFYTLEFSEKKNPRERMLQRDVAWELFSEQFRVFMAQDLGLPFLGDLTRYGQHAGKLCEDGAIAVLFARADLPIPELNECDDLLGCRAKVRHCLRGLFTRVCDWLEALQHLDTYARYADIPVLFQPDALSREIAQMGILHRIYPWLDADLQKQWAESFDQLQNEHGGTPRWRLFEEARTTSKTGAPKYPELDQAIIMLWPLMKQYNWTYRDLMTVLAEVLPEHRGYPCDREQNLATYCPNVLGLRKEGRAGRSKPGMTLPGLALARLIFSS